MACLSGCRICAPQIQNTEEVNAMRLRVLAFLAIVLTVGAPANFVSRRTRSLRLTTFTTKNQPGVAGFAHRAVGAASAETRQPCLSGVD
jgi:hypothetical protein